MTTNFGASPEPSVATISSTKVWAASCTGASASPSRTARRRTCAVEFLARDVDDPPARPGDRGAGLDQERRFADARFAADQRRRARHESASRDPVEFGEAGDEARLGPGRARKVLERERPAGRSPPDGRAADAERRRFFDDRVPLAARFAFALPALGDGPAILADIRRTKLGHGAGLAGLPEPVERLYAQVSSLRRHVSV